MTDIIRVVRVLEYVGPRDHVEHHLSRRYVKGTATPTSQLTIREGIVGDFPEVIPPPPPCGEHCITAGRPTGFHCVKPEGHAGVHQHELGGTYP